MSIIELTMNVAKLMNYIFNDCAYCNPEVENIYSIDNKVYIKIKDMNCYYVADKYSCWTEGIEE